MSASWLRAFARKSSRTDGKGVVVHFDHEGQMWYAGVEEVYDALRTEPELGPLACLADKATWTYDPESEAIVLESNPESVSLCLVRRTEVLTLGIVSSATPA